MIENKITPTTIKGVIIGCLLIVISLAMYFAKLTEPGYQWIPNGIMVFGIIISVAQYAKEVNNNSTFGNYFSHGFKVAALTTIIMIIYTIIFINIFPEFKENTIETARKQMESKNNMQQEDIDKAIDITRKYFTVFAVLGVLVWDLILGCISALIGAAICKKNPITYQEEHINQIGQ